MSRMKAKFDEQKRGGEPDVFFSRASGLNFIDQNLSAGTAFPQLTLISKIVYRRV